MKHKNADCHLAYLINSLKYCTYLYTANPTYPYFTLTTVTTRPNADLETEIETKKIRIAQKPANKATKNTDAPLLNLKDFLPQGVECSDAQDKSLDTSFRATKLEFIILARDTDDTVFDIDADSDLEWEIPDQETFDKVVSEAVYAFTLGHLDRIHSLAWPSTGWNTGVGLVTLTTSDLQLVEEFRQAVAGVEMDGQRFITLPKQMR